jgi:hypothetical protein
MRPKVPWREAVKGTRSRAFDKNLWHSNSESSIVRITGYSHVEREIAYAWTKEIWPNELHAGLSSAGNALDLGRSVLARIQKTLSESPAMLKIAKKTLESHR